MKNMKQYLNKNEKYIYFFVMLICSGYLIVAQFMNYYMEVYYNISTIPGILIKSIVILIICGFLIKFLRYISNYKNFFSRKIQLVLIFCTTLIPRIILIQNFSIVQTSDYANYLGNAISMFRDNTLTEGMIEYASAISGTLPFISKIFSYAFFFGDLNATTLLYLNIIFILITSLCIYYIVGEIFNYKIGFISAITWSIWPNNLATSLYVLSEPMFMCFLCLSIVIYIFIKKNTKNLILASLGYLLSGILLGMAQNIRPIGILYIITFVIILFYECYVIFKKNRKLKLNISIIILCIGYLVSNTLIQKFDLKYLPTISKPTYGWTIYEGNNPYSWGEWSQETSDELSYVLNNNDIEDVQKILLEKGIDQIKEYTLKEYVYLQARKAKSMFGQGSGFANDIKFIVKQQKDLIEFGAVPPIIYTWFSVSELIFKIFIYLFILYNLKNMYLLFTKNNMQIKILKSYMLFLIPLLLIICLHCLATAIQRYAYPTLPLIIVFVISNILSNDIILEQEEKNDENINFNTSI